jgi:hypothetical protein
MNRLNYCIPLVAILVLALAGCSRQSDPISPDQPDMECLSVQRTPIGLLGNALPAVTTSNVINGYLVQFDGRTFADGKTTFDYTVSGTGGENALSHFLLEIPDCAPALDSYTPPGATIGIDPHTNLYGIKWNLSLGTNESRSYSITFPGDVPLGVINASVKASVPVEIGEIAGPCAGFVISGTVYVDADGSGTMDAEESGIVNVTVTLVDGDGDIVTATTDANGDYAFLKIAGTYTIRIDAETAANDFNESLAAAFVPTGPTSTIVTVGPDSPGNDFGFDPKAKEITYDIEQGILLTTGEPVKFWKKQLRAAMSGSQGRVEFDAATMAQFIAEIQGLFLPDPFQFTPGNEFQEAMDILSTNSKDPLPILLKELLAAEFNEVSGKGLVEAPELQSVLLAWAESVAVAASSSVLQIPINSDRPPLGGVPIDERVADTIDLLIHLNGSTGGGSGGGG